VITIGVTTDGRAITVPGGYVLVADNVEQWREHWQDMKIRGEAVQVVTVDVAALTPSFHITEWVKGKNPVNPARDSLARARASAAIVLHELQRELGEHPDAATVPEHADAE
jgi:hypothetical protein